MRGLTQQFDACEYHDRHGWLWYNPNPLNKQDCLVAIEYTDQIKGHVIDVVQDDVIVPNVEIVQIEPAVCDIVNKDEIKRRIEKIVKFIYDMDNERIEKSE